MNTQNLLKEIRTKAGETSAEMASKLNINEEKLKEIENNITNIPADILKKLKTEYADFLNPENLAKLIPDMKGKLKDKMNIFKK